MGAQRVEWRRSGQTEWGDGWVAAYGRQKTHDPGEDEHMGFANFDLAHNNLPRIYRSGDSLFIEIGPGTDIRAVRNIIRYHGFEFAD